MAKYKIKKCQSTVSLSFLFHLVKNELNKLSLVMGYCNKLLIFKLKFFEEKGDLKFTFPAVPSNL